MSFVKRGAVGVESNQKEGEGGKNGEVEVKTKQRWKFKIPFFALMFSYIAVSVVIVGVIGWKFTIDSANTSLHDLASKIQTRAVSQVTNSIIHSARVVNQVTSLQAEMIKNAHSYVLFFWQHEIVGGVARAYTSDPEGSPVLVDSDAESLPLAGLMDTTAPMYTFGNAFSWRNGAICIPSFFFSTTNLILFSPRPPSPPIKPGVYVRSFSSSTNNVTLETAVVGCEWPLEPMGFRVNTILDKFQYTMFATVIEIDTGSVLLTSDNSTLVSSNNVITLNELQNPFLKDFSGWVSSKYHGSDVRDRARSLNEDLLRIDGDITATRSVNHETFFMRASRIGLSQFNFKSSWVVVIYISLDDINSQLRGAYQKTEVIVFSIMGGVVFMGTLFAFLMSRQIKLVVRQIITLKDLRFNEVLTQERSMKRTSFVLELADLQHSFCEMVLTFADHIKFRETALLLSDDQSPGTLDPNDLPIAT
ncbi:hypothetical protein HDU67_005978 [Dinochytrium kinnereticum]|nr:hypothetical protein HDU67_005978 [Dinochytrium kinnereticum]